mmetsp:Transcript_101433/g.316234  ORF Transcript_101433/g.316234 Transcript_101433/m.316234 type:complete len:359 (+) Transcript_101433:139-1215(+)
MKNCAPILQDLSASKREGLQLDTNPPGLRVRGPPRLDQTKLDVARDQSPEGLLRIFLLSHVIELLRLVPLEAELLHGPHELLNWSALILLESPLVVQHAQGAEVHEHRSCLQVPVDARKVYRTLEVVRLRVDLGPAFAEQPHDLRVACRCRMVKSLLGVAGRRVDGGLAVQQQVHHVLVAPARGPVDRPHAREGVLLDARPLVQQELDHVVGSAGACIMQWVPPIRNLLAIQLRLGLQQHHADVAIVLPCREVQHPLSLWPQRRVDVDTPLHHPKSQESGNHVGVPTLNGFLQLRVDGGLLQDLVLLEWPFVLDQVLQLVRLGQLLLDIANGQGTRMVEVGTPYGAVRTSSQRGVLGR